MLYSFRLKCLYEKYIYSEQNSKKVSSSAQRVVLRAIPSLSLPAEHKLGAVVAVDVIQRLIFIPQVPGPGNLPAPARAFRETANRRRAPPDPAPSRPL